MHAWARTAMAIRLRAVSNHMCEEHAEEHPAKRLPPTAASSIPLDASDNEAATFATRLFERRACLLHGRSGSEDVVYDDRALHEGRSRETKSSFDVAHAPRSSERALVFCFRLIEEAQTWESPQRR